MNVTSCVVLGLLAGSLARAQLSGADTSVLPISDPTLASVTVARVGPLTITAREFLLSYEFGPAFVKRQKNSRRRYLDFMVNEKLLALDAAARGGKTSPDVRRSVGEVVGDLATEELYRDEVLSKVRLSEEEVQNAVRGQRTHYALRWVYAPTRQDVERYDRLLAGGVGFDSIFALQRGDSVTADLRSWETTRFKLRNVRPQIASVVDTLQPRIPSRPLEGPDGWYIVFLDGVTIDAITTESEGIKQRDDARRALTQQKADSLSDLYINGLMIDHAPVIQPRAFDLLSAYLAQFWLSNDKRATMISGLSVGQETAIAAIADIRRFAGEPLVRAKNRTVTLERFLSWYRAREYVLRLRASSVQAYRFSLQQMVWKMVRDGLLIERAIGRGLQKRESVRTQKQWWEDKVLYALAKKRMTDSLVLNETRLVKYFRDHQGSYRDTSGAALSFDEVRDRVRKDCFSEEVNRRLLHRLIGLRKTYPVRIFDAVLQTLPVENEADPRAIDAYVAKTGGTFPHPAFPTIDYDWQGWQ